MLLKGETPPDPTEDNRKSKVEKKLCRKLVAAWPPWSEGGAMTPAMVQPHTTGEIIIVGGNHRLAVARAKGAGRVPVLFEPEHLPSMQAKLPSLMVLATHSA